MVEGRFKYFWGLFTNYDDKILAFLDHLPPCVDIFYGINVDKKWIFLTSYLPRLVNVVCVAFAQVFYRKVP